VVGERAELRGLNLEGLRRNGFTAIEVGINWTLILMDLIKFTDNLLLM
jgi:acyl-[acyl carrier protein]--UDP-N-acetylglucosamine O-acyltransferase